jgi:5-methyltetrahydrofolate corrinoid/iron sulfur protein methyltransferase
MDCLGEAIHIISQEVRTAVENRDKAFIQNLAKQQVATGATYLDLNIGPQKKLGAEIMPWMVETVQEVVDVPLSLDTTNAAAIEAGIKVCKKSPIINSTDCTPERLEALMPLAAEHKCSIIALTLAKGGLPTTADARVELAAECIFPKAAELGIPEDSIFLDPLVLTVNGNQDQAQETINAVRFFKQMTDPPPRTTCGMSNVSNTCPEEIRSLLNRVFMVMMIGAGLDSAIIDTLDAPIMEVLRIVTKRDESTPKGKLYVALLDAYAAMEPYDTSGADMSDPEISDIVKTIRIMQNETLYAHSYLRM